MTHSRRRLLGLLAAGGLGGCLAGDDDTSFWDDPPAFDPAGFETVTAASAPERPRLLPVDADGLLAPSVTRAERLLGVVPELSPETLPNGVIREAITDAQGCVRAALSRARAASTAVRTVERLARARACAVEAATVWAAVGTHVAADRYVPARSATSRAVGRLRDRLPASAASPPAAVGVSAPFEAWTAAAEPDGLAGVDPPADAPDPVRAGRRARRVERAAARADLGNALLDRYRATAAPGSPDTAATEATLTRAVTRLRGPTADRVAAFHRASATPTGTADGRRPGPLYPPGSDYLGVTPRDRPGATLFDDRAQATFETLREGPVAWREGATTRPALRLRRTAWVWTRIEALARLRDGLRDGRRLVPTNAAAVRERRAAAITAVRRLADADDPVSRWVAYSLCGSFREPDERLAGVARDDLAGDGDTRRIALQYVTESHARYAWIETVAGAVGEGRAPLVTALAAAAAETGEW